jgi:hypothetical protein
VRTFFDDMETTKRVVFSPRPPAPHINFRHIDGPLLTFSDGQMHWLSVAERVMVRLRLHNAESLQRKLRPNLTKLLTVTAQAVSYQSFVTPRPVGHKQE